MLSDHAGTLPYGIYAYWYIGYGSGYDESEKRSVFLKGLPVSLFTNTSFELYVFFGLISIIAAIAFYQSKDQQGFAERYFVKRYFRFVLPVAGATLLTYFLNKAGLMGFDDIYRISGSLWNLSVKTADVSIPEAIYIAFVKCYFAGNTGILTTLWCMDIIFIGSLLSIGFLAVMWNSKRRYAAYIICALFCIPFPRYTVFLMGIICGDLYVHLIRDTKISGVKRELTVAALLLSSIVIGLIPSVYVKAPFTLEYTYSVATALFICGIMLSSGIKRILSVRHLVSQTKYTFSILLVQIPVQYGISQRIFRQAYLLTDQYALSFWITFIISCIITHAVSIGFNHLFERTSEKIAEAVYRRSGAQQ